MSPLLASPVLASPGEAREAMALVLLVWVVVVVVGKASARWEGGCGGGGEVTPTRLGRRRHLGRVWLPAAIAVVVVVVVVVVMAE